MKIYIDMRDNRWQINNIDTKTISDILSPFCDKNSEVSIILTNDKHIRTLNKKYRGLDKPTNVLSFETGDPQLLGDIFISFDTVAAEALADNKTFFNHTIHMIVHGALHLLGYDHIVSRDAKKMENLEIDILKKMSIENPYTDKKSFFEKIQNNSYMRNIVLFFLGAIAATGFAPFNFWWATVLAIGAAYYINIPTKKHGFWKSVLRIMPFAAAYAIAMFWWMLNSIFVVPELAAQFAIFTIPGIIGIGLFGGFIFAIPFAIIRCAYTYARYRPFLFAFVWAFILWAREWFLTGFPWNPLANITMPYPIISNSMSVFGAIGLSFIIAGMIAVASEIIKDRREKSLYATVCIFCALFISGIFFGYNNILGSKSDNNSPIVRIVQPSNSATQKASHNREQAIANADANIANLLRLAKTDDKKIDLYVFPETVYPYVSMAHTNIEFVKILNVPTILGTSYYDNKKLYNSMLVINDMGTVQKVYHKSHLVPFGEYRPFGDIIPTPGQLAKGDGPELLSVNAGATVINFVPAICYEIIFSDSLTGFNKIQPSVIINITNDTWFGKTPGSYQHLDMVRRYAIESGLPIIRSNYSGISAFIAADGRIISQLPIGVSGILDGTFSGAHITIYRMIGRDFTMLIFAMISIIAVISISLFQKKD